MQPRIRKSSPPAPRVDGATRRASRSFAGLCLALGLAGCSGGGPDKWSQARPEVAPAEGVVTYQGQPLPTATIVFAPAGGKHAASAVTDAQGRFSLAAFAPQPGAVPGGYQVMIIKQEPDAAAGPQGTDDSGAELPPPMRSAIPKKYADPGQSGLSAEVPPGGKTDFRFELRD